MDREFQRVIEILVWIALGGIGRQKEHLNFIPMPIQPGCGFLPMVHLYTELFIEVHRPDNLGSSNYDIRDGIKEHLDTCYPFPLIFENRMEAFKKWIAEFVNFNGTVNDSEKYVLIMTALCLDSLNRNCTLNWNIPNEAIYREKIMSDEEYGVFVNGIPQ